MTSHQAALARSLFVLLLCGTLVACGSGRPGARGPVTSSSQAPRATGDGAGRIERIAAAAAEGGDAQGAAELYARAAEATPDDPALQVRLANSLLAIRDYEAARRSFERALALSPGNLDALRGKGLVALGQDRPDLAIGSFEAALAVDGHDRRSLNGLGVALDATGRHDDAQTRYRQILADDPQDLAARNNLALSLALSGKHGEAADMIGAIAASPASTVRIRQNYALVLGIAGRVDEADRVARQDLGRVSADNNHLVFLALAEGTGAMPQGADVAERPEAMPLKPVARAPLPDASPEGPAPRIIRQPAATAPSAPEGKAALPSELEPPAVLAKAPETTKLAVATPPVAAPVPTFWAQMGIYDTQEAASLGWTKLRKGHGADIGGHAPQMLSDPEVSQGRVRLQTGPFASARAARELCDKILGCKVEVR